MAFTANKTEQRLYVSTVNKEIAALKVPANPYFLWELKSRVFLSDDLTAMILALYWKCSLSNYCTTIGTLLRRAPKHVSLQPEEKIQDCVNKSPCHPPSEKKWTPTLQTIGFANYAELHLRVICDSVSCVSPGYTRIGVGLTPEEEDIFVYPNYYEWAVKWNRHALNTIGIWPVDDHGIEKFLRNLRATVFFILVTFFCTIPCFCSLVMKCDNLVAFIDNFGYFIPFVITQMKFFTIYSKRTVLLPVIRMIAEDWAKRKTDAEEDVMIRHARVGRAFSFVFGTLVVLVISCTLVLPKFGITLRFVRNDSDLNEAFPIPCYYMFDVTRSPYFEMTLTGQLIGISAGAICYTGLDTFLGILVLHICGQLENLRTRLANMGDSVRFDRILAGMINDHTRLIRATDAVERTFTMLLFVLLLYFGTFACIYGVQFISILVDSDRRSVVQLLFLASILVITFLQTFFYCIAGQILATESEGVYDAAYQCKWSHLKLNEAKCLILIMARAKTPLYITAGKLLPMTLLTYCKILKVSLGYLSFILSYL